MKRLFFVLLMGVLGILSYAQEADTTKDVASDTIKLLAGDKEVVIVTKRARINKSIEELSLGKKDLQAKIDEFQKKIDSLSAAIDELPKGANNEDKVESLQDRIDSYKDYIEALQEGIDDINEQLEELQDELADLNNGQEEETIVTVKPKDDDGDIITKKIRTKRSKFRGHWSAIEFGLNNFVLSDGKTIGVPQGAESIEPVFNRSWQVSFNFFEVSLPVTRWAGFVSGLGFQWNNYRMSGDFPVYDENYVLQLDSFPVTNTRLEKAVFKTVYFNVPLLFEIQVPVSHHRKFFVSAGVVGGVNINSKIKRVYDDSGNKIKQKTHVEQMVSPYRYGYTFRIGYRGFQLYADYYNMPLFRSPDNPEIYPVSVGFRFNL